jgi:hypothetical protein
MDYEIFFRELEECYLENGLVFNYNLDDIKRQSRFPGYYTSVVSTSTPFDLNLPKNVSYASFSTDVVNSKADADWVSEAREYAATFNESLAHQMNVKIYKNLSDLVYFMALKLSEKIGKLPDHLHSRMILSHDKSEERIQYVRTFFV